MTDTQQPPTPTPPKPLTLDEIMDLRQRVLSGAPVSDDELREALASMAQIRVGAGAASPKMKSSPTIVPKIDLASAFAQFKAKKEAQS